jgi:hypothetical protein
VRNDSGERWWNEKRKKRIGGGIKQRKWWDGPESGGTMRESGGKGEKVVEGGK